HAIVTAPSAALLLRLSRAHRDLHSFPTRRSSDLPETCLRHTRLARQNLVRPLALTPRIRTCRLAGPAAAGPVAAGTSCRRTCPKDRKSTRLNSSHVKISYAGVCSQKKNRPRCDLR